MMPNERSAPVSTILPALAAWGRKDTAHQNLPKLVVRIGIHSGPVVVGDLGSGEFGKRQALGPTMNVAARLQAIARPGTAVMSDATARLVPGMFRHVDLGVPALKGIEEPIRAYVVLESTGLRGRLDAYPIHVTPFVGRDSELDELQQRWRQVRHGRGQVVLISGEAGIGKSRLIRRFMEMVAGDGDGRAFEWRCSPFHTSTPLHPVIESLEHYLSIQRGGSRDTISPRIQAFVSSTGLAFDKESDLIDASNLLSELLSPGASDSPPLETPAVRRARTLSLLCDLARAQATNQPSVMLMEDVHWADPSTVDLLNRLFQRCSDVPLLLLLTMRPDGVPPALDVTQAQPMTLKPLTPPQCAELFDSMVGLRFVHAALRDDLLSRADGVPLFVEELTRALLDSTTGEVTAIPAGIPNTLQGLLVSRLDRLPWPALETIHLAATLSREFRFEVLAGVSDKPEPTLREDVHELVRSGLLYRQRGAAAETYIFKHALVADAAYKSILRSDRRRLHDQIAHRLRDAFPTFASEQPELLAHHFGEAGIPETAIDYWTRAGDAAMARGAYQEAVRHLDEGLDLLSQVGDPRLRLQREIELTESKGTALFSTLGYAHPQVESTFARASSLCEETGSSPTLRVLYGLWGVHLSRSHREGVQALLPKFAECARSGEPVAMLTAHTCAGLWSFFSGDFEQCLVETGEAKRWYSTAEHSAFLQRHGYGGGLYPFAYWMWSLSILGRSAQSAAAGEELRTLAERSGNAYGLAIARGFRINVARDRRDLDTALELSERQIEYGQRQMLPFWEGPAHCVRGWARACCGETAEGIAEIMMGLQYLDAVGLRATCPYHLGGLAEAQLLASANEAALETTERGLSMCETLLDRFYEAELRRLRAEAHRRLGDLESAESGFASALSLARRQSATLFVVRAATSLATVLAESGRVDAARRELESVLSGLAESLDTTDFANARELLHQIA